MFDAGPEPVVAIKAGKCTVEPHPDEEKAKAGKFWITPQKERGEVVLVKKDDVNHFQWREREMPYSVDPAIDHMVFPGDAEFAKTETGRDEDRVYLLQFKANEGRRFFFWLQDKDDSSDEDLTKKLNDAMNGTSDSEGGTSLGAALRGLQQQAPAAEGGGSPGGAPLSLANLQDVFSSMNMPGAPAPATPAPAGGPLSSEALAAAMASAMATAGRPRVTLNDVATGDALDASGVLGDGATVTRLLQHLPEGQRTEGELRALVRAPQFKQALAQLTSALLTPDNYASILANFGIDPASAPLSGDPVQCFLNAILNSVGGAADAEGDAKMDDA